MTPSEIAITLLVAGGTFFGLVAAIGVIRLPDLYTRAHATSKSDTLGTVLSIAAVTLVFDAPVPTAKAALLVLFVFLTAPTAAHAITRAAYDQGIEPWTTDDVDESSSPGGDESGTSGERPATDGGASTEAGRSQAGGEEA